MKEYDDDDHAKKLVQSDWRAGRSSAQAKGILKAKATIEFIRANPGCTRSEIMAAGISPNFNPILAHRLAYWSRFGKIGYSKKREAIDTDEARWWPQHMYPHAE